MTSLTFFGRLECTFGSYWLPRPIPFEIHLLAKDSLNEVGNCVGMCIAANNIFEDVAKLGGPYPNSPYRALINYGMKDPLGWSLQHYIEVNHWWQLSMGFIIPYILFLSNNAGEWSSEVLKRVKECVKETGVCTDMMLLFYDSGFKKGHAVVPYAVEENAPDGTDYIRVYDPDKAFDYYEISDRDSAFHIDPNKDNSWSYDRESLGIYRNDRMVPISLSDLRGNPNIPDVFDLPALIVIGIVSLGLFIIQKIAGEAEVEQITDEDGKHFYSPDGTINEDTKTCLNDCFPIPIFSGDSDSDLEMYYASIEKTLDFLVSGKNNGNYSFYYMPSKKMMTGLTVDTFKDSKDHIITRPMDLSTIFLTSDPKELSYKSIKEFDLYGKIFSINDIKTDGTGELIFTASQNGDNQIIINNGNSTFYDLKIDFVGDFNPKVFQKYNIYIGNKETHRITPLSWDNLETDRVKVEIDRGNDGDWDEIIFLKPSIPPNADFVYSKNMNTVKFIDISSDPDGFLVNWTWDFGDGNISYQQHPTHQYNNEGEYNITLKVRDNESAVDSISKTLAYVSIDKPRGHLYLFDKEIITLKKINPIIIGPIKVIINPESDIDIDKIQLYVDDVLKDEILEKPFEWCWNDKIYCKHTLKVILYDILGNTASDEQEVWIFNSFP
ncbi:MAG: PKD domain-containing protein [Promethearchaeota archaeon]